MPKPTYGERKRLTEKEKYRALAEIEYFVKKAEKLRAIPDQLDKETIVSPKTREALNTIADELVELNAAWKEYLAAYLDVSGTKGEENLQERRSMTKLLECFTKITKQMEALENDPVAEREEFAECYAEVQNYAGHYIEMANGSLVVPEMTEEQKRKMITVKKEINVVSEGSREQSEVYSRNKKVAGIRLGYSDNLDVPLFPHEPTPDDIVQGSVGDCYFLMTLASVAANNPQMIRDMMKDNGDGTVTVRLYDEKKDGSLEPIYINVEKSTPVYKLRLKDGSEVDKSIGASGCLWVQMLEKAFAAANIHRVDRKKFSKTVRSYSDIEAGYPEEAYNVLFGRKNFKMKTIFTKKNDKTRDLDKLFKEIREDILDRNIVTTGSNATYMDKELLDEFNRKFSDAKAAKEQAGEKLTDDEVKKLRQDVASEVFCGVLVKFDKDTPKLGDHGYTLVNAYERKGKKYVQIRNPHGYYGYTEGNPSSKEDKGYCEIPLEKFDQMFRKVYTAKPLGPKTYEDFSSEYHEPLSELYQGFLDTKTQSSQFMQWLSLSWRSRSLKNALRQIQKLQEQEFPSKLAMMKAYQKLDKAAKAYLEKHKDDNVADMKDITNRRMTIARACLALSGSFLGHIDNERDVQADIQRIGRMMVTDRVMYVTQKSSENGQMQTDAQGVVTDVRVNKSLIPIGGDRLFDIALRTPKLELLGKVVDEVARSKSEKQANPTAPKEEVKENVKQTEAVTTK